MQMLPWIAVLAVVVLALGALALRALRPRQPSAPGPLPTEWALTARPVFNVDERRVYRLLREALPHHIVLSKLPLVRFCQPNDPNEVRYWYDLLGSIHVAFAICSANGRVRYLRCPADHLPTVAELQLLVPQHGNPTRGPQPAPAPAPSLHEARDSLATTVASRRAERTALWQDSTFFQDSFFAPDNRLDGLASEFGPVANGRGGSAAERAAEPASDDVGGVVVDTPQRSNPTRH